MIASRLLPLRCSPGGTRGLSAGDLKTQISERFATYKDLEKNHVTIEEREEYEQVGMQLISAILVMSMREAKWTLPRPGLVSCASS